MKTVSIIHSAFLLFLLISFSFCNAQTTPGKKLIYQYNITEEIAKPAWLKTQKALKEAKEMKADYILIHMNTYGGLLETADSIRTAILNAPIPVWVFIDNNAASAGALISIACDSIYMRKGANIGAATVVNQTGEPLPDKYQSYMRAMMRSTAQATGRNPDIAQGMVDPRIKVEGISDSGQVITFTAEEALKNGYCNAIAENINEVIQKSGVKEYTLHEQKLTATDKLIGFLTKPIVSGILIMIIIAGIYFEFQSPGAVFPIVIGAIAAMFYFAPHYLQGLAANWEIIVFVIGVILLAVEVFAIPGFGVTGIAGIFLMITGLTLAMIENIGFTFNQNALMRTTEAFFLVVIAMFLSVFSSILVTRKLFGGRTWMFGQLALNETQQVSEGYSTAVSDYHQMVGKTGTAYTILRPAGKVMIEGKIYDATALTSYIEKGVTIKVVKYETAQLFVEKV